MTSRTQNRRAFFVDFQNCYRGARSALFRDDDGSSRFSVRWRRRVIRSLAGNLHAV